jgi:HK97 gp10 family phage protein
MAKASNKITSSLKMKGDKELKEKLDRLGKYARAALLTAAKAGADPIRGAAQINSPGGEPILIGNEKIDGGTAEVDIGFDEEKWYLRFFEFGSSTHEVTGKKENYVSFKHRKSKKNQAPEQRKVVGSLAFEGRNGLIITKSVEHPGMAAKPFLRPAADSKQDAARDAAGEVFRKEIDKLVESRYGQN